MARQREGPPASSSRSRIRLSEHDGLAPRPDEHDRPRHPGFLHQMGKMGQVVAPGPSRLFGVDTGTAFPPEVTDAQAALDFLQRDFEC